MTKPLHQAFLLVGSVLSQQVVLAESYPKSQTFHKEMVIEITAPSDSVLHVDVTSAFKSPKFRDSSSSWSKTIKKASWVHLGISPSKEAPEHLESSYFLPISGDLTSFQSSLPLLVLDFRGLITDLNRDYQDCFWGLIEPSSDLPFPGRFSVSGGGGLKGHGSSSREYTKRPFRLEFRNPKGKDRKEAVLELPAASDWVLSPPSTMDPSLIRNPFIYQLSRDCGQYAPRTKFVEVFVKSQDLPLSLRRHYFGVYSLTERIDGTKGRVFLGSKTAENPEGRISGLSRGVIFKYDRPGRRNLGIRSGELQSTFYLSTPSESKLRYRDGMILAKILDNFGRAIKNPEGKDPSTGKAFSEFIDAESWHTWRWLGEMAKNTDLYRASAYFQIPVSGPRQGQIVAGPIWDFDRALNSLDPRDDDPAGWVAGSEINPPENSDDSPWWRYLLNHDSFKEQHLRHWVALRKGPLHFNAISKALRDLQLQLDKRIDSVKKSTDTFSPIERNYRRWKGASPRGGDLASEVLMIDRWLRKRILWIDEQVALQLQTFSRD